MFSFVTVLELSYFLGFLNFGLKSRIELNFVSKTWKFLEKNQLRLKAE